MNYPKVTGRVVSRFTLADKFGVSMDVVDSHLVAIGLLEIDVDGSQLATPIAEKLRLWTGSVPRFLGGGSWDAALLPVLADLIGEPAALNEDLVAQNRNARQRAEREAEKRRRRSAQGLAAEAERVRELELSKLTGVQRVTRMIVERERVLDPQYPMDADWSRELRLHHTRAMSVARACSFTGEYPDFEDELIDRVIFTLDEQMVAARRFVAQGRAIGVGSFVPEPAPVPAGNRA